MTRKISNYETGEREKNVRVEAFLDEVLAVCKKHELSISHEDHHGGFIVVPLHDEALGWLSDAVWDPRGFRA